MPTVAQKLNSMDNLLPILYHKMGNKLSHCVIQVCMH